MRYIDPHLHTILLDDGQMMKIALSGMEACVTPMLHSLNGLPIATGDPDGDATGEAAGTTTGDATGD